MCVGRTPLYAGLTCRLALTGVVRIAAGFSFRSLRAHGKLLILPDVELTTLDFIVIVGYFRIRSRLRTLPCSG
jgi:hypothetical protein